MVVVVVAEHLAFTLLRLLPRPRPHVPAERRVIAHVPGGLDGLGIGRMRVGLQDSLRLSTELLCDLLLEGGGCDRTAASERTGFIGGVSEEHGCVVELALLEQG